MNLIISLRRLAAPGRIRSHIPVLSHTLSTSPKARLLIKRLMWGTRGRQVDKA